MFLEKYKNRDKFYYRLVENMKYISNGKTKYQKKLILFLGETSKYPYSFEELRSNFKNGIALIPELEPYVSRDDFKININLNAYDNVQVKNVGFLLLNELFNKLGLAQIFTLEKSRKKINYDLLGLARLLVFNRILKPTSKIKTFEDKDMFLSDITSSKDFREIYNVLDVFNSRKDKIINTINKNIENSIGRKYDMVYYDVTNYYFEIDKNDEQGLRKQGVSKERRKDPIIQMGMFLDNNSIPVSYELFKGNTLDKQTLTPVLNNANPNLKDKKILIVADRGMVNGSNELNIVKDGNDYLFAKGIRQSNKEIKKWATDENGYTILNSNFKYKSRIIERKVLDKESNKMVVIKEKVLSFWARKYYEKEKNERDSFIEILQKYIDDPNSIPAGKKKGLDKYILVKHIDKKTGDKVNVKEIKLINTKKLEQEKEYLGYYMLVTSQLDIDEIKMIESYRGLTQIENCFRITKSELKTRPVFCRTEEHIKGHFLICYIALTMMRILQYKVASKLENKNINVWSEGISSKNLQRVLKEFNTTIVDGWCMFENKSEDKELTKLLKSLGIDFKFNITKESSIKEKLKFSL